MKNCDLLKVFNDENKILTHFSSVNSFHQIIFHGGYLFLKVWQKSGKDI